jgi:hypothetical protein
MTIVVTYPNSFLMASIASCTLRSLSLSSAEVASSKIRILGFLMNALAIATLCF